MKTGEWTPYQYEHVCRICREAVLTERNRHQLPERYAMLPQHLRGSKERSNVCRARYQHEVVAGCGAHARSSARRVGNAGDGL